MRAIVSKFGGSSTASAGCFRQIQSILSQSPARRCVVLSAPGTDEGHREKVTSMLEECWRLRQAPPLLESAIAAVVDRYGEIARELSMFDIRPLCAGEITSALYLSRDHTLSRGEYLCAALYSEWSGQAMLDAADAISFDAQGRLDVPRTLARLGKSLRAAPSPVILPGFYGADPLGHVVTFPRNGSDITGALAAAAMEAGLYENWTDVPGLMTADPAIVPGARLIPQISYRQMRQLARAGAQVLHPDCLDPVAMAGIPTRLRCTRQPDSFGTLIDDHCDAVQPCLAGRRESKAPENAAAAGECSCVTAFGVKPDDARQAAKGLDALAIEVEKEQARVYVPQAGFEEALRQLHQRLLE